MKSKLFFIFVSCLFISCSCQCKSTGSNNINKLESFMFIYDINNINLNQRPLIDTLFNYAIEFYSDSTQRLVYVVDGTCSACSGTSLNFLQDYSSIENDVPLFIILKSPDKELFKFYLEKNVDKFNAKGKRTIENLKIITIDEYSQISDGLYFFIGRRLIKHETW